MAEQIKFGDRLFLSGERVIVQEDAQINRDLKVNRDVVIQGNLDVNGTVTTIDTTDLFIADPIVGMNYDHTGVPTEDVGFEIFRGNGDNVFYVWDETLDSWSTRGTDLVVRNFHATGDTLINGTLHVDGQSTLSSVNVEDLTNNRIVIVGTNGELEDDANFTFDATTFNIGQGNFTVDVDSADTHIIGTLDVDSQSTFASANVEDLTNNRITIAGIDGELEDDANFTMDGITFDIGQGNFTVDVAAGDMYTSGNFNVDGQTTMVSANVKDLTNNRIIIAGIDGELEDDANFTMDGSAFDIGQGNFTVDVSTGNTQIKGTLDVDDQSTLASVNVEDLTDNRITIAGISGELEDDANFTMDGVTFDIGQGNFTVDVSTGDTQIKGTLNVDSQSTLASVNVEDLTNNRIVIVGIAGELEDDANFTMDGSAFDIGQGNFTVDVSTGDTQIKGTLNVDSQSTLASVNVEDLTNNRIVIVGATGELEDDANFTFDGSAFDIGQGNFNVEVTSGVTSIAGYTDFENTSAIKLPVGTTVQRPGESGSNVTVTAGQIRFNESDTIFEGYDGIAWGSLGGVKDVDQDTYITPETAPGADNDELDFYTTGTHRMQLGSTGDFKYGAGLNKLTVDYSTGNTNIAGDVNISGSTVISGDLTVSGTTTTINTEEILLADNIITLNSNYTGSTPTENAGIEVNRGSLFNSQIRWNETTDIWEFTNDGNVYRPIPHTTDDLNEGTNNLYFTTARARQSIAIGTDSDELSYDNTTGLLTFNRKTVILSDNAPTVNVRDGDIWYDTLTEDRAYVYSTTIGAWIDLSPVAPSMDLQMVTDVGSVTTNSMSIGGDLGVGIETPAKKLHVDGEIAATGDITAFYSDERLKDFEGKIDNALDKIDKINGYYYKGNDVAAEFGYNTDERQVGVSAQEVEEILPEVVKTAPISLDGETDYKTVQYEKLVPLLIEAIKELKDEVEKLKGN